MKKADQTKLIRGARSEQKYVVVVIDVASMRGTEVTPITSDVSVTAASYEEAATKAVAEKNAQNGYGPKEDGGFLAVRVYARDDLQYLIDEMQA